MLRRALVAQLLPIGRSSESHEFFLGNDLGKTEGQRGTKRVVRFFGGNVL